MFKNIDWENSFLGLLWTAALIFIVGVTFWAFATKSTLKYSLGGGDGKVYIVREIDYYEDDIISLDRSVTYEQAVELVRKLNETLK